MLKATFLFGRWQKATYVCVVQVIRNEYMKIKQKILDIIDNPQSRTAIASELKVGEQTIAVQLRGNKSNGRMTKMDSLLAISKVSGYPVSEILEQEPVEVKEPQN